MTVLEDNDPMDEYQYLLTVRTGHRRGASTSSQVKSVNILKSWLLESEGKMRIRGIKVIVMLPVLNSFR